MSTRAEVMVTGSEGGGSEKVYLDHHSDGYPSDMLPMFKRAFKKFGGKVGKSYRVGGWKAGRAGYVAGFLCAEDYGLIEPEDCDSAGNHGDLEFFYVLRVSSTQHPDEHGVWALEVRAPDENGAVILKPTPVQDLPNELRGE
ncbi:MAG: hypothetical protein WCB19_05660 [Thermoplasmata archaeon]